MRNEADFIITNPPFSLFREFLKWIIDGGKQFSIIGNMNAITYKEVFPLLKDNKIWLGNGFTAGNAFFATPNAQKYGEGVLQDDGLVKFRNCCWFTNIELGKRHEPLPLMTMADNLKFSRHKDLRGRKEYQHYDNYDAIEVPYTDAIPSDYTGAMGVPISFLDKYCPEQFKITGITKTWFGGASKTYPEQTQVSKDGKESTVTKLNDGATLVLDTPPENETYYKVGGKLYTQVYARILIQKITTP